jgi:hypothetical protein
LPSTGRTIRILGKNGEEAFVNLPSLPRTYSQASSSVRHSATNQPAKRSETSFNHDEQSHSSYPKSGIDNQATEMIPETRATASKDQMPSSGGEWAAIPQTITQIRISDYVWRFANALSLGITRTTVRSGFLQRLGYCHGRYVCRRLECGLGKDYFNQTWLCYITRCIQCGTKYRKDGIQSK